MEKIWNFLKDEDGLELSEYAVMGALIVAVVAAAVTALQGGITGALDNITTTVGGTPAG